LEPYSVNVTVHAGEPMNKNVPQRISSNAVFAAMPKSAIALGRSERLKETLLATMPTTAAAPKTRSKVARTSSLMRLFGMASVSANTADGTSETIPHFEALRATR
jgi:hypothetical protein